MSAQKLITDHLDLWTGAIAKKSSSGRGSSSKIELAGIRKLRELILELAVQGKLVLNSPQSTSFAKLLLSLRQNNVPTTRRGRQTQKVEISAEQQPFKAPKIWAWMRLGEIAEVLDSQRKPITKSARKDGPYPYYGASGIVDYVDGYLFDEPLVLVGEDGAKWDKGEGTAFPISGKSWVNNHAHVLRPNRDAIADEYLVYFLTAADLNPYITGMTVPKLNQARLVSIPVALPCLDEQRRIVQKVDELMTLCDRLEQQTSDQLEAHETLVDTLLGTLTQSENATDLADNWARLATHFDTLFTTEQSIDKLKQTILQLAVMGRLVEQEINDEPTAHLLERVSEEKQRLVKSKVLKRTTSLAALDTSALPLIPERWSWVNLGDIISVMDAGWSPACAPRPARPEEWGVLKTTAVQIMKYQEFENKQLPDNMTPKKQYEVRSGDILITRAGPKNRVGISCVVKETRDKLMISDKIIRFHLIEAGVSEEYICLCLNAGETHSHLERAKSGMAESQMNISQDKLKEAPIPLCPVNEQNRIIKRVGELNALCDQLKERLNQASETRCQLADAIVEGALH